MSFSGSSSAIHVSSDMQTEDMRFCGVCGDEVLSSRGQWQYLSLDKSAYVFLCKPCYNRLWRDFNKYEECITDNHQNNIEFVKWVSYEVVTMQKNLSK